MQTKKLLILTFICFGLVFSSCETLLEPEPENYFNEDMLLTDMPFAEGLLLNGLHIGGFPANESAATDDAVSNQNGNAYRRMATGEWSSQFDPMSNWSDSYKKILYLNTFLNIVDDVQWSWTSEKRDKYFRERFTGEAHGLRAWHNFNLLRNHAGRAADGTLLGYVMVEKPIDKNDDWKKSRSTFEACVQQIYADIDKGIEMLPMDYVNTGDADYDVVYGRQNHGRVTARILMGLKSRVALHVASQAYDPTVEKWEFAADASAALLKTINGVAGLSNTGHRWYNNAADKEIIWRKDIQNINSWERDNYPPSMFGNGRINPTQNLVDAFPMRNGYPISHPNSNYNPANPYLQRDQRLAEYIVYNGNRLGTETVQTTTANIPDGLNQSTNATRTGYYLKKFMHPQVNLAPEVNSTRPHFHTLLRYTEIFLNYAEAANEAWGPTGDPRGNGFTAASIMGAIRKRGGTTQPDAYLNSISSKEQMRDLIRNERRIELSFEGFRFWDLRRWNLDLSETAKGMSITDNEHSVINVEERGYKDHMIYGPIPYMEILRNDQLIQNAGW